MGVVEYLSIDTLWLFNIAVENDPFIDDLWLFIYLKIVIFRSYVQEPEDILLHFL